MPNISIAAPRRQFPTVSGQFLSQLPLQTLDAADRDSPLTAHPAAPQRSSSRQSQRASPALPCTANATATTTTGRALRRDRDEYAGRCHARLAPVTGRLDRQQLPVTKPGERPLFLLQCGYFGSVPERISTGEHPRPPPARCNASAQRRIKVVYLI